MKSLTHLLLEAQAIDSHSRELAGKALEDLSHNNPIAYLLDLSKELSSTTSQTKARQLAGILIKNLVQNAKNDPVLHDIWQSADPSLKITVRNSTLGCLASDDKDVRLIASQTVASLACLDIPLNNWPELLGILIANSTNLNKIFRVSAIRTLGYICDGLPEGCVSKDQADSILTALASNLDGNEVDFEIKQVALESLRNSLKFIRANMSNDNERGVIFRLLYSCCGDEATAIRKEASMIICDIAMLYYDYIESNLIDIGTLTYNIIRSNDNEIAIYAIELWNQIADEEVIRVETQKPIKGYINTAAASLVPLLLEKIHIFEDEQDEWSLHKGCASTLASVSLLVHDGILQIVGEYITKYIKDPDFKKRASAAVIIGSVVEGIRDAKLLIQVTFQSLIDLLSDPIVKVRETSSWTISKICEFHAGTLISENFFNLTFQHIINLLKDFPNISAHACWTIVNLFKKGTVNVYLDAAKLNVIIDSVIQASLRPDAYESDSDLLVAVFCAINGIIEEIPDELIEVVIKKINVFLSLLDNTLTNYSVVKAQGHICCVLGNLFGRASSGVVTDQEADKFVELILKIFNTRNTVVEEGLQAIGTLAENIGIRFKKYLVSVIPFIEWCLKSNSPSLCKSGVITCGDLSRAIAGEFNTHINRILPQVFIILASEQLSFEVKIRAIDTLADFASHNSEVISQCIHDLFKYIEGAAVHSLDLSNSEIFDYLLQLRESIMTFYVGVIQGLHERRQDELIFGYVPRLLDYSLTVVLDYYKPNIDMHVSVIGIIGDVASYFGSKITHLLRDQKIKAYLDSAKRIEDKNVKDILAYTNERLSSI